MTVEKEETHINFHPLINAIVHDQAMSKPNSMRLHRMTRNIGIVTYVRVVEVGDFRFVAGSGFCWEGVKRRKGRHGDLRSSLSLADLRRER